MSLVYTPGQIKVVQGVDWFGISWSSENFHETHINDEAALFS